LKISVVLCSRTGMRVDPLNLQNAWRGRDHNSVLCSLILWKSSCLTRGFVEIVCRKQEVKYGEVLYRREIFYYITTGKYTKYAYCKKCFGWYGVNVLDNLLCKRLQFR